MRQVFLETSCEFLNTNIDIRLSWCGLDKGLDIYSAELNTAGLFGPVWYRFRLEWDGEILFINAPEDGLGGRGEVSCERRTAFQLSVYEQSFTTPEWYGEGITYHIFPDRFARTKLPDVTGLIGDRIIRKDWDGVPIYKPDAKGEIKNNDFFGGNLQGIISKLSHIKALGVTTIYLSPIFYAASNHRYDTADYLKIDPVFGDEKEFTRLCREAEKLGIRIILDGVFNHTGFDSRYFNARGSFDGLGAYQSTDSPYYKWYKFNVWPGDYSSWWGIYTLPQVEENDPDYREYIISGEDSVVKHWLKAGASGWRLDVADELPDDFIEEMRVSVKKTKPDAVLIGEVWEDASNKISYDTRRSYLYGHGLDGVMNYPFRNALLGYLLESNAGHFERTMESIRENYPAPAYYSLMNILGTHDTPRVLTVLGAGPHDYDMSRDDKAWFYLRPAEHQIAVKRLKIAALIQFAFPGSPCLYYGDEAGLQGFEDPFNRRGFPWGNEDPDIVGWYQKLGELRNKYTSLKKGSIRFITAKGPLLAFERVSRGEKIIAAANAGAGETKLILPAKRSAIDLMTGKKIPVEQGEIKISLPPMSSRLIRM